MKKLFEKLKSVHKIKCSAVYASEYNKEKEVSESFYSQLQTYSPFNIKWTTN